MFELAGLVERDQGVELGEALFERNGAAVLEEAVGAGGGAHRAAAAGHGVVEHYLQGRGLGHLYADLDGVLEGGGMLVAAFDGHHRRHYPLGLHAVEAVAQLVHPVDPRLFHEADVVAVVRDAHAVALVVFHLVAVGFDVHSRFVLLY